jgi:sugar (pentulose or hexulose) kinase
MSTVLLVILTVIEIVALVAVLALFVILITRRLRAIANALGQVSGVVIGAIQGDVFLVGAGAAILNRKLNAIANALPAIAEAAESLPLQQKQAQTSQQPQTSQQQQTLTSGNDWRPAVAQDRR